MMNIVSSKWPEKNGSVTYKFYLTIENRAAGILRIRSNDSIGAHITDLFVGEDFRKQGYGTKIINECISIAQNFSRECLNLYVRQNNDDAIKFYEYLGFKKIAVNTNNEIYMSKRIKK